MSVATQQPGSRRTHRVRVKMCHLSHTVNSGIGASGANQFNRMIRNLGQRQFQTGLYGSHPSRLRLPAQKSRAIVLDA